MRVRCVTLLVGGELTADRSVGTGFRAQYLPGGDVLHAELRGQSLALRSLAAARGGDHRQPHFASQPETLVARTSSTASGRPVSSCLASPRQVSKTYVPGASASCRSPPPPSSSG